MKLSRLLRALRLVCCSNSLIVSKVETVPTSKGIATKVYFQVSFDEISVETVPTSKGIATNGAGCRLLESPPLVETVPTSKGIATFCFLSIKTVKG